MWFVISVLNAAQPGTRVPIGYNVEGRAKAYYQLNYVLNYKQNHVFPYQYSYSSGTEWVESNCVENDLCTSRSLSFSLFLSLSHSVRNLLCRKRHLTPVLSIDGFISKYRMVQEGDCANAFRIVSDDVQSRFRKSG